MVKINTEKFKSAISTVIKGASYNKILKITYYIGIYADMEKGEIRFYTTDNTNYLTVMCKAEVTESFDICLHSEVFSKLVSKLSCDTITLEYKDNVLTLTGNGVYTFPVAMDEEGVVLFPKPNTDLSYNVDDVGVVEAQAIHSIVDVNKSSIAVDYSEPVIRGYLIDSDKVTTTDAKVACFNSRKTLGQTILISPEMMDLLVLFPAECKINYLVQDKDLYFWNEDDTINVFGPIMSGVDSYPNLSTYFDLQYPYSCKISKTLISDTLDRLALFVDPLSDNGAYLQFGSDNMKVYTKDETLVETITYIDKAISTTDTPLDNYLCMVDIPLIKSQMDSIPSDNVQICFGDERTVCLIDDSGTVKKIVVLLSV